MQTRWTLPSRRTVAWLHVAYVLVGGWLLLRPVPDAPQAGVGWVLEACHAVGWSSLTGSQAEFLCNIALFVPLPLMWVRLAPRVPVWAWPSAGFVISGLVELFQWVVLPQRSGTARDIVANTAGTLAGAGLVWLWRVGHRWVNTRQQGTIGDSRPSDP